MSCQVKSFSRSMVISDDKNVNKPFAWTAQNESAVNLTCKQTAGYYYLLKSIAIN